MCVAIAGSEEALRRRPILMTSFPVVSPLTFDPDKVDVLLEFCRFGLPVQTYSIPAAGGTSPVTLAGSLAQQMAEVLAGVILGQLIRPGAPIRVAGNGAIIDQKYGSFVLGCPEAALIIAASAQMFRYYGLPYALLGGESQARTLDMQAGYEKGIITLLSALSGAGDILPGVASTVGGAEFSIYEQAVIANDICGMIYRILQGIEVNPDTLAVSVIREVGPGGHFLKQRHTREHYKLENWEPKVSNRIMSREEYEESGARDVRVRAREEVKRILATHHPKPLSEAAQRKLEQIVKEAEG
jgi:trimethylamine--corrinoid protein Co-methyltransferase